MCGEQAYTARATPESFRGCACFGAVESILLRFHNTPDSYRAVACSTLHNRIGKLYRIIYISAPRLRLAKNFALLKSSLKAPRGGSSIRALSAYETNQLVGARALEVAMRALPSPLELTELRLTACLLTVVGMATGRILAAYN